MVDTGINRLGLTPGDAVSGLLAGVTVDTLHSHLACADTPDHPLNAAQAAAFGAVVAAVRPPRASLANSAGVALGPAFAFDLTRPGIGLYGGRGGRAAARLEARVVQVRRVAAGDTVGYGATWTAATDCRVAVVNLGYADGFACALGPGRCDRRRRRLPGRRAGVDGPDRRRRDARRRRRRRLGRRCFRPRPSGGDDGAVRI